MNVHFTHKLDKSPAAEQYLQLQIDKLRPRLHVFNPDMVSLHGLIEFAPKSGFSVALNLRLPSGQLVARSVAVTLNAAIRSAFEDLGAQLGKHKDHLRSQYRYPSVRAGSRGTQRPAITPQAPFEETVAAIRPDKVSSFDVTEFVNANLGRLSRYVERELSFRRDGGQVRLRQISAEEVIDEAIASALDEHNPRPEKISLEPWLYRLSRSAMDRLANMIDTMDNPARPNHVEGAPSLDANDEERLQYYQPDASTPRESMIADDSGHSPEDEVWRQELMTMVERSLRGVDPLQREAFLLFTIEGFRLWEIATITGRELAEVESDIKSARQHLRSTLPAFERRQKPRPEQVAARPKSA